MALNDSRTELALRLVKDLGLRIAGFCVCASFRGSELASTCITEGFGAEIVRVGGKMAKGEYNALLVLSVFQSLAALALIIISAVLVADFEKDANNGLGSDLEAWLVYTPLAIGIFVLLYSILGCIFAGGRHQGCLAVYGVFSFVFSVIVITCGALLIQAVNYTDNIAETPVQLLSDGTLGLQHYLSDFSTGIYNKCCNGGLGGTLNPQPENEGFFISSYPTGANITNETDLTADPLFGDLELDDPLFYYGFYDEYDYEDGNETKANDCQILLPTGSLGFCPYRESLILRNGVGLKLFQRAQANWAEDNLMPAGIAVIIFGVLLFISFIVCMVACLRPQETAPSTKNEPKETPNDPEQQQQQQQPKQEQQEANQEKPANEPLPEAATESEQTQVDDKTKQDDEMNVA